MLIIGLDMARKRLPKLLDRVHDGEALVIEKRGQPYAMLVPLEDADKASSGGRCEGLFELRGSGEGLWADDIVSIIDGSRDEWGCQRALLSLNDEVMRQWHE